MGAGGCRRNRVSVARALPPPLHPCSRCPQQRAGDASTPATPPPHQPQQTASVGAAVRLCHHVGHSRVWGSVRTDEVQGEPQSRWLRASLTARRPGASELSRGYELGVPQMYVVFSFCVTGFIYPSECNRRRRVRAPPLSARSHALDITVRWSCAWPLRRPLRAPVAAHWESSSQGWLRGLGFIDFAGCGPVRYWW